MMTGGVRGFPYSVTLGLDPRVQRLGGACADTERAVSLDRPVKPDDDGVWGGGFQVSSRRQPLGRGRGLGGSGSLGVQSR